MENIKEIHKPVTPKVQPFSGICLMKKAVRERLQTELSQKILTGINRRFDAMSPGNYKGK